eukprot:TRINITY_DN59101_c0_g1_i1.p1 TRINITY_DN59101_c0_g1~~TRINITY_DN59101_c0_g1_i1.p1  ORF type:complete len:195 (+),score=23.09 TRINITY_DN59101_c0_g1_i1:53-637(+)
MAATRFPETISIMAALGHVDFDTSKPTTDGFGDKDPLFIRHFAKGEATTITNPNVSKRTGLDSFCSSIYGPSLFHHDPREMISPVTWDDTKIKTPTKVVPARSRSMDTSSMKKQVGANTKEMSSIGALEHGGGACRPCAWVWKQNGCKNGSDCTFCHSCPPGALKARRRQKTMTLKIADRRKKTHPDDQIILSL